MHTLVLGATGYLGSVTTEHLLAAGHQVTALLRPGRAASGLPRGIRTRRGDLTDPASLERAVTADVDAVLHLATPTGDAAVDTAATAALLTRLRGTDRVFLYTSGVWVLGATGSTPVDEDAPVDPIDLVGYRPAIEHQVLAAAAAGVRSVVVRPGVVHGRGEGIPALLVEQARAHGGGRYVGDSAVRWPMVHVDDLADLFVLAVERAAPGSLLHAVAEEGVPVTELARAAARAAGVQDEVRPWPREEATAQLGAAFAEALALHQVCSGDRARRQLGWQPRRPGAVVDVAAGSYRCTDAA